MAASGTLEVIPSEDGLLVALKDEQWTAYVRGYSERILRRAGDRRGGLPLAAKGPVGFRAGRAGRETAHDQDIRVALRSA